MYKRQHLRHYNIPDHLVETAKYNFAKNLGLLVYRTVFISIAFILSLPGIIMFSPVFILANRISKRKAREALAGSTVKIKANDVIATWKILIGMGFAPLFYNIWSILITYYFRHSAVTKKFIFIVSYICCVLVTYSALIVGDIGMDIFKSLRPLYLSLTSPRGLRELQKERESLTVRIIEVVNTFGPDLFPGFDGEEFTNEFTIDEEAEDRKTMELKRRRLVRKRKAKEQNRKHELLSETDDERVTESDAVSLVNSDNSLSNIPIFSSMSGIRSETSISRSNSSISDFESDEDALIGKSDLAGKIAQAVMNRRADVDEEIGG